MPPDPTRQVFQQKVISVRTIYYACGSLHDTIGSQLKHISLTGDQARPGTRQDSILRAPEPDQYHKLSCHRQSAATF